MSNGFGNEFSNGIDKVNSNANNKRLLCLHQSPYGRRHLFQLFPERTTLNPGSDRSCVGIHCEIPQSYGNPIQ